MCLRAPPNSYLLIANDFSLEDQGYVGVREFDTCNKRKPL